MDSLKKQALKFRIRGYSYNEINRNLGVPKSTLSNWFSHVVLSDEALNRLEKRRTIGTQILIDRNKMQTELAWDRMKNAHAEAAKEIENSTYKNRDLLLIGAALYWGEGYKRLRVVNGKKVTGHVVSLTNSDPDIIRTFVLLLNHQMKVPLKDIQLFLRLYESIDEKKALKYWLKASGLPSKSFKGATYFVSISSKRKKSYNSLPYGTAQVIINNTQQFHRIMGWIEWIKEYIVKLSAQ